MRRFCLDSVTLLEEYTVGTVDVSVGRMTGNANVGSKSAKLAR